MITKLRQGDVVRIIATGETSMVNNVVPSKVAGGSYELVGKHAKFKRSELESVSALKHKDVTVSRPH